MRCAPLKTKSVTTTLRFAEGGGTARTITFETIQSFNYFAAFPTKTSIPTQSDVHQEPSSAFFLHLSILQLLSAHL